MDHARHAEQAARLDEILAVGQEVDGDPLVPVGRGREVLAGDGVPGLEERELERHKKAAALSRQCLGEGKPVGLRIKAAQDPIQRLHSDGEAVRFAQSFGDSVVHLGGDGGAGGGDPVGGLFERREMVGAIIEEVARLLIGQQNAPP